MLSRVPYFILILFRYRYSRNYIKTTTLCGICIVLSPYARSKIKSGTLTSFANQKRLPGGANA